MRLKTAKARSSSFEPSERESGKGPHDSTRVTTAQPEPSGAALAQAAARAAVASIALGEIRKLGTLADRRERLLLARAQLRKSLAHVEADLKATA